MQGVPERFEQAHDRAVFARPAHRAGVELYRAHIVSHAFEPHTHEAYGFGTIEAGVERFRLRGAEHLAPAGALVAMNPDELHTGRAESEGGWRYRMVYLDPALVEAVSGEPGWWFDDAVRTDDPWRAARVAALIGRLWDEADALAFDEALAALLEAVRPLVRTRRDSAAAAPRFAAVREFLHEQLERPLTLDEIAAVAGLSPFHFLRSFKAAHGATPQQMLMALRLHEAKRRLARGQAPADVAAACGLADQAHLTRAFARRYGVTPGRYQQQLGTRPR